MTTDKIEIVHGDIVDIVKTHGVEVVVNAAKRTLMGGSGVDGSIHNAIDKLNQKEGFFKEKIKEALDGTEVKKDDNIRCNYGNAVVTSGYGLAKYVIHAVGPKWDGNDKEIGGSCSKSCIDKLKHCYNAILDCMLQYGCNSIAIPVISSGSYRFPFATAAKVQFAAICNFLTRLKKIDLERFEMINKIYIVVFDKEDTKCIQTIRHQYVNSVNSGKQLLYLTTEESYRAYLKEVQFYDSERRNYFATVKYLRLLLIRSEKVFIISFLLRKILADKTWEGRRTFIEIEALSKCLIPLIFLLASPYITPNIGYVLMAFSVYLMLETLVYAAKLLFLSDIQNPSANGIRSILLLFANYLEINISFAFLYKFYKCFPNGGRIDSLYAAFEHSSQVPNQLGKIFVCFQNVITLYFIGVVFTYFVNSFQSKKFNTL